MLWREVNLCSHSALTVQEDLPGVESAIFLSVIQESLHDIGGEKGTSYQSEPSGGHQEKSCNFLEGSSREQGNR